VGRRRQAHGHAASSLGEARGRSGTRGRSTTSARAAAEALTSGAGRPHDPDRLVERRVRVVSTDGEGGRHSHRPAARARAGRGPDAPSFRRRSRECRVGSMNRRAARRDDLTEPPQSVSRRSSAGSTPAEGRGCAKRARGTSVRGGGRERFVGALRTELEARSAKGLAGRLRLDGLVARHRGRARKP